MVGRIQAKRDDELRNEKLGTDIAQRIASGRESGQPLAPETRSEMEASFHWEGCLLP